MSTATIEVPRKEDVAVTVREVASRIRAMTPVLANLGAFATKMPTLLKATAVSTSDFSISSARRTLPIRPSLPERRRLSPLA